MKKIALERGNLLIIQKVCNPEPFIQCFLKGRESVYLQIDGTSPASHHNSPP